MTFSIVSRNAAVGVDGRGRGVVRQPCFFEIGNRQDELPFFRNFLHTLNRRLFFERVGEIKVLMLLIYAEVGGLEQFLQQDDLGAAIRRLVYERFRPLNIVGDIPGAMHLRGRNGYLHDVFPRDETFQ